MSNQRFSRSVVVTMGCVALVLLGVLAFLSRSKIRDLLDSGKLPRSPGARTVSISPGKVELKEFLRFLQEYTGLQVIVSSELTHDSILAPTITKEVDGEMARVMLDENGYSVEITRIQDGNKVLRIRRKPPGDR